MSIKRIRTGDLNAETVFPLASRQEIAQIQVLQLSHIWGERTLEGQYQKSEYEKKERITIKRHKIINTSNMVVSAFSASS